jgi:hypothetical protein
MADSFAAKWQLLVDQLVPGMNIPNWTKLKGYLGDSMKIAQVNQNGIIVQSPKAKNDLHISRDEFEKIFGIWSAYMTGTMHRKEICEVTFYSKYIISIIHWLENN